MKFLDELESPIGSPDPRVIKRLEKLHPLPQSFLAFSSQHHGKAPSDGLIKGKKLRIGRFLSLIDDKSSLPSPFIPHFEDSSVDVRVMRSIAAIIWFESATSRALYYGERLLPIAALFCGDARPDEMCMDRCYVDFLCLDYDDENKTQEPPVVLWQAEKANAEFLLYDEDEIDEPRYKRFTKPIAKSFTDLLSLIE